MSLMKRLLGRLSDSPAPDEKTGKASPIAAPAPTSGSAPAGPREAVVHALIKQIVHQSENGLTYDSIDPDAAMCDRGYIDSLTYVAFLVFIEETYGVRISDYQLTNSLRTVSAVAAWILVESKGVS